MPRLHPFKGLDQRPDAADEPGYLAEALNCIIQPDGTAIRRPATRYRINLPADSVGLYSVGDSLRTLAPFDSGDLTADDYLSPTITVDYINAVGQAFTILGTSSDSTGRTFALIRRADQATQLHHAPLPGTWPGASTLLAPGFTPNFSLIGAGGRLWTLDANLRFLRYSYLDNPSNLSDIENFTPTDLVNGANALNVGNYAAGSGTPQGVISYGERVAVLYLGRILLYRIDADQGRIFLEQQKQTAGTRWPLSAVEVGEDLIFLSEAGVRTMTTVTQALDAREDGGPGSRIDPLARSLSSPVNIRPIGHYARRLGCYLLAFGTDVLCLSLLPGRGVLGWSRWTLPMAVDAFAESGGLTWIRSGNNLFSLDDSLDDDQTGISTIAPIPAMIQTLPINGPTPRIAQTVATTSTESLQVQVIADGRPALDISGAPLGQPIILPPRGSEPARATSGKWGRSFAVRIYDMQAKAGWRVTGAWLEFSK